MESYWILDLEFEKANGLREHLERNLDSYETMYFTYKRFKGYKLSNYIKSETISRDTEWDFLDENSQPYEYLRIKRRFIIPEEVIISERYHLYEHSEEFGTIEKDKIEYTMKFKIDKERNLLKPVEIIYFYRNTKINYEYSYHSGHVVLLSVNYRLFQLYDRSQNSYKYYYKNVSDDIIDRDNLYGQRAKETLENEIFDQIRFEVTSTENVEQVS